MRYLFFQSHLLMILALLRFVVYSPTRVLAYGSWIVSLAVCFAFVSSMSKNTCHVWCRRSRCRVSVSNRPGTMIIIHPLTKRTFFEHMPLTLLYMRYFSNLFVQRVQRHAQQFSRLFCSQIPLRGYHLRLESVLLKEPEQFFSYHARFSPCHITYKLKLNWLFYSICTLAFQYRNKLVQCRFAYGCRHW